MIRSWTIGFAVAVVLASGARAETAKVVQEREMSKQEVVALVDILEMEVNNGGFDQFFFNSSGDRTADTIEALEAIGAQHTASIVKSAASRFPGGMPSVDRNERQEQLEKLSPDANAFEVEDAAFYE